MTDQLRIDFNSAAEAYRALETMFAAVMGGRKLQHIDGMFSGNPALEVHVSSLLGIIRPEDVALRRCRYGSAVGEGCGAQGRRKRADPRAQA
ncbi:MAG: hypothetical protein FWD68_00745 [Alphaproteobacteria bacterium]|nr:hypothetical protein [Alphaproteobacteria bacterium]